MGVHVIIDGYNLIHASNILSGAGNGGMEEAREALVDILASYKKRKAHAVTVVFDAQRGPVEASRRTREKGIEVVFSGHGLLADAVIKKMAQREREKAVVVTSDRDVASFAVSAGATAVSAQDFGVKLMDVLYGETDGPPGDLSSGKGPGTRKKGPSKREPKSRRKAALKSDKL